MTRDEARNFIMALNQITPYVPPMHMQVLTSSPVCRIIEQVANTPVPEPQPIMNGGSEPRTKPSALS